MTDTANIATANAHGLACPACRVDLVMSERQGIEIDYCPKCRGVWLDRGELDKIVERGQQQQAAEPPAARPRQDDDYRRRDYDDDRHRRGYGDKRYRRKSWLSEIFD